MLIFSFCLKAKFSQSSFIKKEDRKDEIETPRIKVGINTLITSGTKN